MAQPQASNRLTPAAKAALTPLPASTKPPQRRRPWLAIVMILLLLTGLAGAGWFFRQPLGRLLQEVPVVGRFFPAADPAAADSPGGQGATALSQEEKLLQARAAELDQRQQQLAEQESALQAREEELNQREAAIQTREAGAEAREQALNEQQAALEKERADRESAEARRAQIIAIYQNMRPQQIAATFEAMTDDEVLEILGALDPELGARVLALMDPWHAARLAQRMMP